MAASTSIEWTDHTFNPGLPPLDESGSHTIPTPTPTEAPAGPVELVDAICWAAHAAFGDRMTSRPTSFEARHFLRHLATNGHHITTTRTDPT